MDSSLIALSFSVFAFVGLIISLWFSAASFNYAVTESRRNRILDGYSTKPLIIIKDIKFFKDKINATFVNVGGHAYELQPIFKQSMDVKESGNSILTNKIDNFPSMSKRKVTFLFPQKYRIGTCAVMNTFICQYRDVFKNLYEAQLSVPEVKGKIVEQALEISECDEFFSYSTVELIDFTQLPPV